MLQSALDHYRVERRITAAGLIALRRQRFDTLDALARTMAAFQLLAAREAVTAVPAMLAEQGIDSAAESVVAPYALLGTASDGRPIRGLLDYARDPRVTSAAFDLIVSTQLQDVARQAAATAIAVRPQVHGYVRMLTLPSCSRCVVQAGKFFRRNAGFLRHPRCDCRHIPSTENLAGDLRTDPRAAFESMTSAAQDATFTKDGAEAIRKGADISQVVNARAGMSTAQVFGRQELATTIGPRAGKKVRLMPESILELANSDAEALRLLKAHGYVR